MHSTNKILVLGGCRSGKSSHALSLAGSMGKKRIFVATCVPYDVEMTDRVRHHQQERGQDWHTLEVPLDLSGVIKTHSPRSDVILIDCLTLWLSNLLMENDSVEWIQKEITALAQAVKEAPKSVVLVSNEVGAGIVPENRVARLYRDLAGWMNQAMARACNQVIWTVAGIPVTLKPSPDKTP
ncbi:bifunctional adenosylcobinamide kinase/adenosylcobinamide-phosphate guanylyltransferase [Desulfosarcina sp. OttesenSCG-928-A07]|nr:bifunctional adenosylcobinamide kinase/adenosylcobinamide-phosphate guanylyltransferase [Desulfosarcina sp. OttesenSCG-928-G17]MDL2329462.1 bifunctional adenosylcobinamide kinase/adenosylcobinamide-phosphate guanylyltransferase [Desulfosarcina sp. OttesenSCG-928-A07]